MTNRPSNLRSPGGGVQNRAPQSPDTEGTIRKDGRGLLGDLGWKLFGAMPRGWVIAILAVLAWVVLMLIVLAVWSLVTRGG